MSERIVTTRRLGRRFGPRGVLQGLEVAVVGPNGSGKTTFLKFLAGLIRPTLGTARVFGLDPYAWRPQVMARSGFALAPPPVRLPGAELEHRPGRR